MNKIKSLEKDFEFFNLFGEKNLKTRQEIVFYGAVSDGVIVSTLFVQTPTSAGGDVVAVKRNC